MKTQTYYSRIGIFNDQSTVQKLPNLTVPRRGRSEIPEDVVDLARNTIAIALQESREAVAPYYRMTTAAKWNMTFLAMDNID